MADFFSIGGLEQILSQGEQDIQNLMSLAGANDTDELIDKTINDISTQIAELKKNEGSFLSLFGCLDVAEFRSRVKNYYNYSSLGSFTGSSLKNIVNDFKAVVEDKRKEHQQLLEQMIYNVIYSEYYNKDFEGDLIAAFENKQITNEMIQFVIGKIIGSLSGAGLGKGGQLQIEAASKIGSIGTNDKGEHIFEVAAHLTTKAFNQHLASLQKGLQNGSIPGAGEWEKQKLKEAQILLKPINNVQISGLSMKQSFAVQWNNIIQKGTSNKSGKGSDIDVTPEELHQINTEMQTLIVNEMMHNNPMANTSEVRSFLNDRISSMWQADPKMFFIGGSYTKLEGVLGEINAIVALTALLGENYHPKVVKWVGSQLGAGGKQPSVDIAIRDIAGINFGIQIKNTMEDLDDEFLHSISFADSSINNIFGKLGIRENGIQDVIKADTFNVPYKKMGHLYRQVSSATDFSHSGMPGDFSRFLEIEKEIDNLVTEIDLYLAMYASDFLYIGLGNSFKSKLATLDLQVLNGVGGNYVYIVGPEVFFASEMLEQLQNDLSKLNELRSEAAFLSIQFESYFEKQKGERGSYNIVTELNAGTREGGPSRTIKLRSSWNFHR